MQNVIAGGAGGSRCSTWPAPSPTAASTGLGCGCCQLTFPFHDELEGYWHLSDRRGLFAVARRQDNVFVGDFRATDPRTSPPLHEQPGAPAVPASGRSGQSP